MRAVIAGLCSIALVAVAASPAAAASQRPSIPTANPAALGSQPNVVIRDRVLPLRRGARSAAVSDIIPANAFSGSYTAKGMKIKIAISPSYSADAAEAQSWADFLADLPQRGDAATMDVYFAPLPEMQAICGSDADACYDPNDSVLILLGETAPDGASVEEVAAHEFGHHIANHRSNAPWSAFSLGPKRWATKLKVCQAVRGGTMFADDPGDNYDRDPTEGWAEAYRVSAGQNPTDWSIVSDIFRPDAATQKIALLDATSPWRGNTSSSRSGKLLKGRSRTSKFTFLIPHDGTVKVGLKSSRGLNADLELYDSGGRTRIGSSRLRGRSDSVTRTLCGQRSVIARVTRSSGSGSFKLTASVPSP
jgi:hypothetical protein